MRAPLSLFTALLVCLGLTSASLAQTRNDRINLMVMSDDADTDAVPRNNRIFNRVQLALSEFLNTRGFQVYDETAIAMGITAPGRVRRADAELIEIARAVSTPIDAMAVYQIYASVRTSPSAAIRFPDIRIAGRILNVRTGQFIAAFEVGGFQLPALPSPCDRECLLETVGGQSRIMAADLGAALSQKLEAFARPGGSIGAAGSEPGKDGSGKVISGAPTGASQEGCVNLPTDYEIQLRDFTVTEVNQIEGEFVRWGCYQQHRTLTTTGNSAGFFYRTSSDSARLTRNFRLMLELVGLNAQVTFAGNRVILSKIATR
jgi:hypothetical protein